MHEFNLTLSNGLPLIQSGDDILLLDTGSPTTIHRTGDFTFAGRQHNAQRQFMGVDLDYISEQIGAKITALMGMDIMSQYIITLDYKGNHASFGEVGDRLGGESVTIDSFMGIPIVEIEVRGEKIRVFLDTGAHVSYLLGDRVAGLESDGEVEDFYPTIGTFTTPCYKLEPAFEGHPFGATFGVLPRQIEPLLHQGQVKGIIGMDFFNSFKVGLDMRNSQLTYGLKD